MRLVAVLICTALFIHGLASAIAAYQRPRELMGDSNIPYVIIAGLVAWAGLGGVIVGVFAP